MTETRKPKVRERWGTRIGLILAVAGSAVGLGNFLRFPVRAAANGGGAFMVPYLLALLLLGIPLALVEWTLGRYGGQHEHGGGPGVYHRLTHGRPWAKYLGVITILVPLAINFYYVYVESWTISFSFFSLTGAWDQAVANGQMDKFLAGFTGAESNQYFDGPWLAVTMFLIVFAINYFFLFRGLSRGIEVLSKYGMPILFVCGVVLAVRVLTLGTPNPAHPDWNVNNALGFMWNPDWARLTDAKVWIEAAGQVFFTLSVGMGAIMTYASYLRAKDDVVLSSVTASSANEFAEVVLGSSIAVVAAGVFFGVAGAEEVASKGAFNLGFVTMPYIFAQMGGGAVMGFLWFFLLFIAGITSSVSLIQPFVTFLKDELDLSHRQAVAAVGLLNLLFTGFVIATFAHGTLDEMDFWAGSVLPVVSGLIMILLFNIYLGTERGFKEMHRGAKLQVPRFYRQILRFVTPAYIIFLLLFWGIQDWWPTATMRNITDPDRFLWVGVTRALLLLLLLMLCYLVYRAEKRGKFPRLKGGSK